MGENEQKNKELDERIAWLREQLEEVENKPERDKKITLRYVCGVFVICFLVIASVLIRVCVESSVRGTVNGAFAQSLSADDSLVSRFNLALDSMRAVPNRYASGKAYSQCEKKTDAVSNVVAHDFKASAKSRAARNVPVEKIDINKADTSEFKRLSGIGTSRAKSIVKYRELLGGFFSVEQLYEVYCMDSIVVTMNLYILKCDSPELKKIRINHIDPKTLYHPYLVYEKDYSLIKAIRKKLYGGFVFSSFADIEALPEYDKDKHSKARHYIDFK